MKPKAIISACLVGIPCRYDGKHAELNCRSYLAEHFDLIAVCPECLGGLGIPRMPAEIRGGRVETETGQDVTDRFRSGAEQTVEIAKRNGARIAILKNKSPSCGVTRIYDGNFCGALKEGVGVTTRLLQSEGILCVGEDQLASDADVRALLDRAAQGKS